MATWKCEKCGKTYSVGWVAETTVDIKDQNGEIKRTKVCPDCVKAHNAGLDSGDKKQYLLFECEKHLRIIKNILLFWFVGDIVLAVFLLLFWLIK